MSPRKCRLTQWYTTTYLLECPKSRTLTSNSGDSVNTHTLLVGMQNIIATMEDSVMVLYKLHILLSYDPAIMLLGYLPKGAEFYVDTKTFTQMFITGLFIIAQTWKQPRCPSVDNWVNKLYYIQITEYYSVQKRNKLWSHEKTWRNLKCILLSERDILKRQHTILIPTIWHSWKGKTTEAVKN